ncbi:MAG TPA: hypothetical protein ENJ99_00890, partial [Rhizobiales bacterium]|nr:hypothetical protein [Hyphomicrobiales bacterium]
MFSGFCGKVLAAGLVFVFVHDAMADGLFDPGKKFTIYKGGALLGDPAIFVSVGSGRYGGTFV